MHKAPLECIIYENTLPKTKLKRPWNGEVACNTARGRMVEGGAWRIIWGKRYFLAKYFVLKLLLTLKNESIPPITARENSLNLRQTHMHLLYNLFKSINPCRPSQINPITLNDQLNSCSKDRFRPMVDCKVNRRFFKNLALSTLYKFLFVCLFFNELVKASTKDESIKTNTVLLTDLGKYFRGINAICLYEHR